MNIFEKDIEGDFATQIWPTAPCTLHITPRAAAPCPLALLLSIFILNSMKCMIIQVFAQSQASTVVYAAIIDID